MVESDIHFKIRDTFAKAKKRREEAEIAFSELKQKEQFLQDIYTFSISGDRNNMGVMDAFCELIHGVENKTFGWHSDCVQYIRDGKHFVEDRAYLMDQDFYSQYFTSPKMKLRSKDVEKLQGNSREFILVFERVTALRYEMKQDYWGFLQEHFRDPYCNPCFIDFGRNNEVGAFEHEMSDVITSSISNEKYEYLLSFVDYCANRRIENMEEVLSDSSINDYKWSHDLSPFVKTYTKDFSCKK